MVLNEVVVLLAHLTIQIVLNLSLGKHKLSFFFLLFFFAEGGGYQFSSFKFLCVCALWKALAVSSSVGCWSHIFLPILMFIFFF